MIPGLDLVKSTSDESGKAEWEQGGKQAEQVQR